MSTTILMLPCRINVSPQSQQFPASEIVEERRGIKVESYCACAGIRGRERRYTGPMRPLRKLTFDAFRDELARAFAQIEETRNPQRLTWELPAVLMSAFARLFFQHPSLLEYQRRMKERTGQSNLERVFGVKAIPSDTQWGEVLAGG